MTAPDLDYFASPHPLIGPIGEIDDENGAEYLEIASECALKDGSVVWSGDDLEIRSYEGDTIINVVAFRIFEGDRMPVGCYECLNLWVHPDYRDRGIGSRLACEAAKLRNGSAVNGEISVSFSDAGWEAHMRAFELYEMEASPSMAKSSP